MLPKLIKRNIFFDLGANEGDSIANFFGLIPRANGGSFKGQIPQDKLSEKWTVYAIEGNWAFTNKLLAMKTRIEKLGHEMIVMNGTVGWIYDGFLTFYIDKTEYKPNSVVQLGSSAKENHLEIIRSNKVNEKHPCVDIAKLLKKYDQDDFIVVKMDIEGSDYDLMLHFIAKNALELIDYIAIEWHWPDYLHLSPYKNIPQLYSMLFKSKNVTEYKWA